MPINDHRIQAVMTHLELQIAKPDNTRPNRIQAAHDLAACIKCWEWIQEHDEEPENRDRSPRRSREEPPNE